LTPEQIADRDVYVELNRNESRIIAERLRGMLTFQGLLFAAVSVSAGQRLFLLTLVLATAGAVSCWPWRESVRLSYRGTEAIGREYNKCKPVDAPPLDACNISPAEFRHLPEVFLPQFIALIWSVVFMVIIFYWAFPPPLTTKI
jgi:hypothetical protein